MTTYKPLTKPIQTKPKPNCPECGESMELRRPREGTTQNFDPFWGCSNYPDCRGVLKIDAAGKPICDEFDDVDDEPLS